MLAFVEFLDQAVERRPRRDRNHALAVALGHEPFDLVHYSAAGARRQVLLFGQDFDHNRDQPFVDMASGR
ncbi:hypothetical protein ABZV34_25000 [Streptomyces sp. NPDC005195]|uniref:hypothetical protein n=1 Tax=Streptomyces sp. NPDC005195 TaxID=3154561 RepID=UPI0033AF8F39